MKDPLLAQYTREELQIEYLMHLIELDPSQAYPRGQEGNVAYLTGDTVVDQWERLRAEGKDADYDAGVDAAVLERVKAYSRRVAQQHYPVLAETQPDGPEKVDLSDVMPDAVEDAMRGFSDDYSKGE